MSEYSQKLAVTVKRALIDLKLTQQEQAGKSGIDVRTIINIENGRGNPKLEKLFPLVKALELDAREIFEPEKISNGRTVRKPRFLAETCSEEAEVLLPVTQAVLSALRFAKKSI